MANDLAALMERLRELPAGVMLTVLIPKGQVQAVAGLLVQENETFHIPGALFVAPALPAPPPKGDDAPPTPDAPPRERFMVATSTLNIRAEPDRNAANIGQVKAGERVAVAGASIGGYVALSGRVGYVLESGLTGA